MQEESVLRARTASARTPACKRRMCRRASQNRRAARQTLEAEPGPYSTESLSRMSAPEETEEEEVEFDYGASVPVILESEQVAVPDTDLLCRKSGAEGVLAVRVTADLDVEYLDGETRVWLSASVPAGPRRRN